jgi:hypothetical protein
MVQIEFLTTKIRINSNDQNKEINFNIWSHGNVPIQLGANPNIKLDGFQVGYPIRFSYKEFNEYDK